VFLLKNGTGESYRRGSGEGRGGVHSGTSEQMAQGDFLLQNKLPVALAFCYTSLASTGLGSS